MESNQELEIGRAEAEAAALEANLSGEVARLTAAAMAAQAKLHALRSTATETGGPAAEVAGRLQRTAVPQLKVDGWREEALAARSAAMKARMKANEAVRQAVKGFSAELSRLESQLGAEESALESARRRREQEEVARRAQAQSQALPQPIPVEERTPTRAAPPPLSSQPVNPSAAAAGRRAPRVRMQAAIDLHSESNFFTGFSTNISDGGIFIATVEHVALGTEVDLAFSLPSGRKVQVHGVVRWSREVNDRTPEIFPGVGIQFTQLTSDQSTLIHEFVTSREPMFFPD